MTPVYSINITIYYLFLNNLFCASSILFYADKSEFVFTPVTDYCQQNVWTATTLAEVRKSRTCLLIVAYGSYIYLTFFIVLSHFTLNVISLLLISHSMCINHIKHTEKELSRCTKHACCCISEDIRSSEFLI